MSILKSIHFIEKLRFLFFLNIFTIIILLWIYHPEDTVFTYGRTIENKNKRGSSLNICFKRYLAEYEGETENDKTGLYNNSPCYFENKGTNNFDDYVSIYGNIKNRDSIKLKLYKTGYKHRHAKKKGLSKLDCYYEKKIFDKIEDIDKLVEKMQNDKKSLKKKLYNKFGIRFILFSLVPFFGLIIPLVHYGYFVPTFECYADCSISSHKPHGTHDNTISPQAPISKTTWKTITIANWFIYGVTAFIVLSIIIYIYIKFIKYQRLKACRSKMNIKEYCKFCKSLFI
ncbi:Plasmodium exported protein, unknown function [Plasmodium vivax]|uniref:Uncharacterized protein n=1 Tax=Plasmodium vivax TaxID=5855 RepID=A0A1G4EI52_PLAVI|nr:Plasmodium exported protein, unknown function [Plasmodium vivax]VUZ93667.1 Plasmodium exported protein, unknown function [Plasmodium vivax]